MATTDPQEVCVTILPKPSVCPPRQEYGGIEAALDLPSFF